MSYAEARELLRNATRGIKERPWEVLNASLTVKRNREMVKCPTCSVSQVMRFQADQGQSCYMCTTNKNA